MRSNPHVALFMLLPALAFCSAPVLATQDAEDEPIDPTALKAMREQETNAEAAQLPNLGEFNIGEVLQFDVIEGHLQAQMRLDPTHGLVRIDVKGLPGVTRIMVRQPDDWPDDVPLPFQFSHWDFSDPEAIAVLTEVYYAGPQQMVIARTVEAVGKIRSVQLIQNFELIGGLGLPENPANLYVQEMNEQIDDRLRITAANFEELRRSHPAEVAEYLQPIFRDLGAEEAVFAVDSRAAWQVFADYFEADDELVRNVERLVQQLDADDFREREAASEQLAEIGQPAALVFMSMEREGLSAEQNARIDGFLQQFRPLTDEQAQRLRNDTGFLLSLLQSDDVPIRRAAAAQLQEVHGRDIEFDPEAAPEVRADQVDRLRDELERQRNAAEPQVAPDTD